MRLALAAAAFQILALGWMAGARETIAVTGTPVYLRTAPVDPRDPFRGDYLTLRYPFNEVRLAKVQGDLRVRHPRGAPVYAALKEAPGGLHELDHLSSEPPPRGLYLRGRVENDWRTESLSVKYGLEAYFTQQGKAAKLEQRMRGSEGVQVPLEMRVAISSSGTGVLTGHRWCDLGMGLEILEAAGRESERDADAKKPPARRSAKVKLRLMNASTQPKALVLLPEMRSIILAPADGEAENWSLPNRAAPPPAPRAEDIVLLQPGEEHALVIDLADKAWLVKNGEAPGEIGALSPGERFRLIYTPPDPEICKELPQRDLIWHGQLPSRAFSGSGVLGWD